MPVPPSKMKMSKKDGVQLVDSTEKANYYIEELTRAALRDVGKFIVRETKSKIRKRTGKLAKNIQYWVRKRETDLLVGFKPGGWYGIFQELGTTKQPKIGALRSSVDDNIDMIQRIEGQYLSAIADEQKAQGLIDEDEMEGDDN